MSVRYKNPARVLVFTELERLATLDALDAAITALNAQIDEAPEGLVSLLLRQRSALHDLLIDLSD